MDRLTYPEPGRELDAPTGPAAICYAILEAKKG